ncbi:MAG: type II toxin-antitoxin system VapC family toxin [Betaproteobacteria bacterium]|jgi:PIN domain nuclease of toxin-antitoxin system|nr:type II toxin-antitoxin system VapC family toxin [Betaproteobacteria bacterium]
MRILLDTHVFIWATLDDARLSPGARTLIQEATEVYVSAASIWEIAIKSAIGKIDVDAEDMVRAIELSGFIELPVAASHAMKVATLPFLNDHKDPFDRLLVAQSMVEPLVLLTADPKVVAYGGLTRSV